MGTSLLCSSSNPWSLLWKAWRSCHWSWNPRGELLDASTQVSLLSGWFAPWQKGHTDVKTNKGEDQTDLSLISTNYIDRGVLLLPVFVNLVAETFYEDIIGEVSAYFVSDIPWVQTKGEPCRMKLSELVHWGGTFHSLETRISAAKHIPCLWFGRFLCLGVVVLIQIEAKAKV